VQLSDALADHANDLTQAYEALRQLETARSDYLHRVAHHIRSPLATLERMMAVVAEGRTGELSDRAKDMLERARKRLRGMLELARDLLVLSRTREALPLADRTMVDLVSVVHEVAGDFRHQAASASVRLVEDCPPEPVEVLGDEESLGELFENLVSNAIKYSPNGGEVRISVQRRDREVEVCVSDEGMGIPPGEEEQIFDEFYRATNAREGEQEGTGLGLSIVKAVVESYGGSVSTESELGRGTCFRLRLPRGRRRI
jgi:signal transduction histidine kinase